MEWLRRFICTGFFSGYSPKAPGTAGSIVAMIIYLGEYYFFQNTAIIINAAVVIIMLYPAILMANGMEKHFGCKDPQQVVLDEMMGYWISVFFLPFSIKSAIIALILFRIFDILKPFPIYQVQKLKGGYGIMLDDYLGGVFTNVIMWALVFLSANTGIRIL